MKEKQQIILDCAPGPLRPGDLIGGVIKGLLPKRESVSKFFGAWVWDYSDISIRKWKMVRPVIKERIEKLFHEGHIRYGRW